MSIQSLLPQELWDEILDILQDDPKTLKTCSLTYREWLPRARKYLFTRVVLHVDHDAHKELHQLFYSPLSIIVPTMADSIRWMAVFFPRSQIERNTTRILQQLFSKLSNIHTLELAFPDFQHNTVDQMLVSFIPVHLTTKMLSLRHCRFSNSNDMFKFIRPFRNLTSLIFSHVQIFRPPSPYWRAPSPELHEEHEGGLITRMSEFRFENCTLPFVSVVMSRFDKPPFERCPRDLVIGNWGHDLEWDTKFENLLQFLGPSLRSLRIPCNDNAFGSTSHFLLLPLYFTRVRSRYDTYCLFA